MKTLRVFVVPAFVAVAACAAGDQDRNAQRSSSRAEGEDAGAPTVVADPCVRAIDLGMFEGVSTVVAINERGEALIREEFPGAPVGHRQRSYLWDGSERTLITAFDSDVLAIDINEHGDIIAGIERSDGGRSGVLIRSDGTAVALGTLSTDPTWEYTDPEHLNDAVEIAGQSSPGQGGSDAFFWRDGTLVDIGRGDVSFPIGLTEDGRTVVTVSSDAPVVPTVNAYLWDHGQITELLPAGAVNSQAMAMNASAHVLLRSDIDTAEPKSFLWRDGTYVAILPFGVANTNPVLMKVNAHDDVLGEVFGASAQPFFWRTGVTTEITIPNLSVDPAQLDDRGVVTGAAFSQATQQSYAFAWKDGSSLFLESGPSFVTSINQHGLVGGGVGTTTSYRARIWDTSGCFAGEGTDAGSSDAATPEPTVDAGKSDAGGKTW